VAPLHDAEHVAGLVLPPVVGGEGRDFLETAVAGGLRSRADQRQIDHAFANYAAIVVRTGLRHQPVAGGEREQALVARAANALTDSTDAAPILPGGGMARGVTPLSPARQFIGAPFWIHWRITSIVDCWR